MIVISGADKVNFREYDKVYYITVVPPDMVLPEEHHFPELAPPEGLFWQYRKKQIPVETLLNTYGQMLWSGKYSEAINNIMQLSNSGAWIQLVCYCKDYTKCHRYVLYKYLCTLTDKVILLDEVAA